MITQVSDRLLNVETTTQLRPRFEGSNINSWMGFKHINYLVEEAVLGHLRSAGLPAHVLYEDFGLCVELVDLDMRIHTAFQFDDIVEATVAPEPAGDGTELSFVVTLRVQRGAKVKNAARSRVRMQLRRDVLGGPAAAAPEQLRPFIVDRIVRGDADVPIVSSTILASDELVLRELTRHKNAFAWRWRIPYFYCHFTERLQMSGYLRQMEETVDLFLADRGISIKRLLDEQRWIPIVTHNSIAILDEVQMEQELYTVFTVEQIFKSLTYTARMDTYIVRNGQLICTATGRITHGYARIENRRIIRLVELDARMMTALAGAVR